MVKVADGQEHVSVAEIDALLTCTAIRAINWNEPSASLHLVQVGKDRWKLWSRRTSWAAMPASPHPPRHRRRGTGLGHCEWRRCSEGALTCSPLFSSRRVRAYCLRFLRVKFRSQARTRQELNSNPAKLF